MFFVCCFRLPTDCSTLSRAARPKLHFFRVVASRVISFCLLFFSHTAPFIHFFFSTRRKSIKLRFRDYVATTLQLHRNYVATTSYLRRKSTLARVAAPQVRRKWKNEKPPLSGHHAQTLGPRPLWRGSITNSGFLDLIFYAKLVPTYQSPSFLNVEFISSSCCCCFKCTCWVNGQWSNGSDMCAALLFFHLWTSRTKFTFSSLPCSALRHWDVVKYSQVADSVHARTCSQINILHCFISTFHQPESIRNFWKPPFFPHQDRVEPTQ